MSIRSDEQNIIAARNREIDQLKQALSKLRSALDRADGYIYDLQLRCYLPKRYDDDFRKDIRREIESQEITKLLRVDVDG